MLALPFSDFMKISFAGYHTDKISQGAPPSPWVSGVMPIFDEKSASSAMMKHAMVLVVQAIRKINPGQTPVICGDQPLFALMKKVQWKFPERLGEDRLVVMMGSLHLEMSMWGAIGKLLENSGWDTLLAEAEVVTVGVAEGLLHVSHLKRTQSAHEILVVAFSKLKSDAYAKSGQDLSVDEWSEEMSNQHPTFFYWDLIVKLQMTIFMFVRAHHERNFICILNVWNNLAPFILP